MLKQTLACAILAASSHAALAANNMDLKVNGNIAPVACDITLGNGGVIDYGNISPDMLSATALTTLAEKQIPLQIDCDAPIKVAIRTITRRPGTAPGGMKYSSGNSALTAIKLLNQIFYHGLGTSNGGDIGGYTMTIHAGYLTADGVNVKGITREDGKNWGNAVYGQLINSFSGFWQTWSDPAKTEPLAFKTLNTVLRVQAYIDKKSNLDVSKPIKLNGASVIELTYL